MPKRNDRNNLRAEKNSLSQGSNFCQRFEEGDHFELLSAYIDGEVTAAQRQEVEKLLSEDTATRKLYQRLFSLRQGLRNLPIPQQQPVEDTVEQVLKRVNRPYRRAMVFGGTAIAACIIGTVSGLFMGGTGINQYAQQQNRKTNTEVSSTSSNDSLQVAINAPVFPIPKAANSFSEDSSQSLDSQDWDIDSEFN